MKTEHKMEFQNDTLHVDYHHDQNPASFIITSRSTEQSLELAWKEMNKLSAALPAATVASWKWKNTNDGDTLFSEDIFYLKDHENRLKLETSCFKKKNYIFLKPQQLTKNSNDYSYIG